MGPLGWITGWYYRRELKAMEERLRVTRMALIVALMRNDEEKAAHFRPYAEELRVTVERLKEKAGIERDT